MKVENRRAKPFILLFGIILMIIFLYSTFPDSQAIVQGASSELSRDEVQTRMAYHGTYMARMNPATGQWWFYNDRNEKCKLW